MARKINVTRTIKTTTATALCVNTITAEPYNETVTVSGEYTDTKKLLKVIKRKLETEDVSVAAVVESHVNETLYGMTEETFIANAEILPTRTKKETEEN